MTAAPRDRWRGALLNRSRDAIFLCYHSIAPDGPEFLTIPPELFERQLRALRDAGYASGRVEDLAALAAGRRPARRTAFISFDDGFRDNASTALPMLLEHGFEALFFILPRHVDDCAPFDWPEVAEERRRFPELMRSIGWPQVDAMAAAGMQFGSHTLTHPHLDRIGDEQLREELVDSRRAVVERLGSCETVAYPFGHWSPRVAAAAAAAGYSYAFALPDDAQLRGSRMSIPRMMVDRRDDERRFALKLSPAGRTVLLSPARTAVRVLLRRG